jgi:excisionase family DNA binding protein
MATTRTATSQDVAAALGVSAATIARYARDGKIPFSQTAGKHRRFDVAEVEAALDTASRVHLEAIPVAAGRVHLGSGASSARGPAGTLSAAAGAHHTTPAPATREEAAPVRAIFKSARRVLVGAAIR